MRVLLFLPLALSLLAACGPATTEECSEDAKVDGYKDLDGDGHGDALTQEKVCEVGVAQWVSTGQDCDDTRREVNPDEIEACDGIDNDCDGAVDENLRGIEYYLDGDADGYGHPDRKTEACSPPPGYVENSADCDDGDDLSYPGSDEFCDEKDNDCDGLVDDADPDTAIESMPWWYLDADGDTYGNPDAGMQRCAAPSAASVDNDLDCNDASALISPDAIEVCDAFDNDCDGLIDDSDPSLNPVGIGTWYYDFDGDGLGDASEVVQACNQPWFYVGNDTDCDDADEFVLDAANTWWLVDDDGDGYGDPLLPREGPDCDPPTATGYAPEAAGGDCDDQEPAIHPGATEICDTLDNDCDLDIDDADADLDLGTATDWYADGDGDLYGDGDVSVAACEQPGGYVTDGTDCDDGQAAINPGALEVCNNVDDDCRNGIDEADPNLDPSSAPRWYTDFDGDGWGDPFGGYTVSCTQPLGLVDNDLDCDDNNDTILGNVDWVADGDGDGVGAGPVIGTGCVAPDPYAVPDLGPQDCDDADPDAYPGADELCGDGVDQDCDGVDQDCPADTCAEAMLDTPVTGDARFTDDLSANADDISFAALNACTDAATDGGDAILPIQVAPGEAFEAWMVSAGDASLYLVNTCTAPNPTTQCFAGTDNVAAGGTEHLWYTNTSAVAQTLYLVADCEGPCGAYDLTLDFGAFALADTCLDLAGDAPITTGGHTYRGSLAGFSDDSDLGPLGCTGIESGGGEAFLSIELQAGQALTVLSYTQTLDDASVYVVDSCADTFGTCYVGADANGAGASESLGYTNTSGATDRVYLALDCYLSTCREFTAKFAIE